MKRRELINMPLNREFEFTDGIYNYVMKKVKNDDDTIMQVWQRKGWINERFVIFESIEFDKEENRSYVKLNQIISIGGFSSHSEVSYWQLGKLKLLNDNSLKKWLMKTSANNVC